MHIVVTRRLVLKDVFIFKQKTAYERRISDWSSDVCSSDLKLAEDVGESILSRRLAKIALDEHSPILAGYFSDNDGWKHFDQVSIAAVAKEIGRASCRDSGCQYV